MWPTSLSSLQTAKYSSLHDFKAPRTDHITQILHKLHWLLVCDRTVYKISTLCHTSLTVLSPHYLSDSITFYVPSRGLCSSPDTRLLSIDIPITKYYGQRTFAYQAPHVWCKLPFENSLALFSIY